jgi:L-threonylcarbamoyladenylate synthase
MSLITKDIDIIVKTLKEGDVVALPTETVYGLSASIFSERAIKKIFEIKKRPISCPLSIAVKDVSSIENVVSEIPKRAKELIAKYLPGPITFILRKKDIVSDIITSGSSFVGVRVPDNDYIKTILSRVYFPIVLTSANIHDMDNCTDAYNVEIQLGDRIKYILDGGQCKVGKESTIVSFKKGGINIVREGAIKI